MGDAAPQFLSFNPAMLAAVRANRKTVTRRRFSSALPLNDAPGSHQFKGLEAGYAVFSLLPAASSPPPLRVACPFGMPGTRLRVLEAAEILLEIVAVRAERVQAITEAQAVAEGIVAAGVSAVSAFRTLIDSIYPSAWVRNEWVWVIEFRRVQ